MGIQLGTNFDVNAALPLDSRTVVADETARDAIIAGKRYEGLTVYVEADEAYYQLQGGILDANWSVIGSGGGGADVYYYEDFSKNRAANVTSDNDPTFGTIGTGFVGTLADDELTPIAGRRSLVYTQAAGSLGDWFMLPSKVLDLKQQGNVSGFTSYITYTGDADDLKLVVWDVTNSVILSSDLDLIPVAGDPTRFILGNGFHIPVGTLEIAIGVHTIVENIGAVLTIDEIELSTDPFIQTNILDSHSFNLSLSGGGLTTVTGSIRWGASLVESGSGMLSYDDATGLFTAIRKCNVGVSASLEPTGGGQSYILKNGTTATDTNQISHTGQASNVAETMSGDVELEAGDYFVVTSTSTLSSAAQSINVMATALNDSAISPAKSVVEYFEAEDIAGLGSTATQIPYYTTVVKNTIANLGTMIHDSTNGTSFTAIGSVRVTMDFNHSTAAAGQEVGISLGGDPTIAVSGLTAAQIKGIDFTSSASGCAGVSRTIDMEDGEVLRPHANSAGVGVAKYGSVSITVTRRDASFLSATPRNKIAIIKDVKTSGVAGGTFTSGAWQTRDINTVEGDVELVSVAGNQFSIKGGSGEYFVTTLTPAHHTVNGNLAKLHDTTNIIDVDFSTSEHSGTTDASTTNIMKTRITHTDPNILYEIQHRCSTTRSTDGFGSPSGLGQETYTIIAVEKLS